MFTRLRTFAGVLLALSLLPAASGVAQCADHGEAGSSQGSESSHSEERAAHAHHVVQPSNDHASSTAEASQTDVSMSASTHVAADNCCPPSGVPGECDSAMGCSVMSATPEQRTPTPMHVIARAIVADGVEQAPGPSRAPEVPPPRS